MIQPERPAAAHPERSEWAPSERLGAAHPERPDRIPPERPGAARPARPDRAHPERPDAITPLMRQYERVKRDHRDAILIFRLGDFYEMFHEDAELGAAALDLTLTSRNNGKAKRVPLAGFPVKAAETYIGRLIAAGYKVAICEQMEDPRLAKGIVKREVIEVVTPGALLDEALLDRATGNFLAALATGQGATRTDRDAVPPGSKPAGRHSGAILGLAFADISTGEFWLEEVPLEQGAAEIARMAPAEVLVPASWCEELHGRRARLGEVARARTPLEALCAAGASFGDAAGPAGLPATVRDDGLFEPATARACLLEHLGTVTLAGFGVPEDSPAVAAAGAALAYLSQIQPQGVRNLASLRWLGREPCLQIDEDTLRNLEVFRSFRDGERASTLLGAVDATRTSFGARLLRTWLLRPLSGRAAIGERQDVVAHLRERGAARAELRRLLQRMTDVPRVVGRCVAGRAAPRDLGALRQALERLPAIAAAFGSGQGRPSSERAVGERPAAGHGSAAGNPSPARDPSVAGDRSGARDPSAAGDRSGARDPSAPGDPSAAREVSTAGDPSVSVIASGLHDPAPPALLTRLLAELDGFEELCDELGRALVDEPPAAPGDGPCVRAGYDAELDRLRESRASGQAWIAELQRRERERTGISSLKVGFNRVFGYFIEITKTHLASVPPEYQRKQTIAGGERFVTPELKEMEARVLGAEEKIGTLEAGVLARLRARVAADAAALQRLGEALAAFDVLAGFAEIAAERGYCRPAMVEEPALEIQGGRHAIVEAAGGAGSFVPNDTLLDERRRVMILTGPNMAGKSTYLRQVGLIALLAHTGACVPADAARVGLADRIFTRVGASDDLARGRSTFLVEMVETANILRNATPRSLVLLDEIGRGTATFDGLSLAWAVTEALHAAPGGAPRTIFATHYHELTELAVLLPQVFNAHAQVREWGEEVVFLKKVADGKSDRSYGIQVARLAGIPEPVVERAREILANLESGEFSATGTPRRSRGRSAPLAAPRDQITIFEAARDPLREELETVDVDALRPLEALNLLAEWKRRYGGGA